MDQDSDTDLNVEALTITDGEGSSRRIFEVKSYIPRKINSWKLKKFILTTSISMALLLVIFIVVAQSNEGIPTRNLIVSSNDSFWFFHPDTGNFTMLLKTANLINNYDVSPNNKIFWVHRNTPRINFLNQGLFDENSDVFFEESRSKLISVAVDFIGGNLYAFDNATGLLIVIDLDSKNYNFLPSFSGQLQEFVLDPVAGLLFYLIRLSSELKIKCGSMNGTFQKNIVSGQSISDITLDRRNKRIYWVDNQVAIESSDYDGNERKTLLHDSVHIASIAVSKDRLFWLWHQKTGYDSRKPVFWSCEIRNATCTNHSIHTIDSQNNFEFIRAVPETFQNVSNPCQFKKGGCQHLCIVSSETENICACKLGWQLNPDRKTCREVTEFLLINRGNFAEGFQLDASQTNVFWPTQFQARTLNKSSINFDYDLRHDDFYFSDDKNIYRMRLKSANRTGQELLLTCRNDQYIAEIAYDWLGDNLYYSILTESKRQNSRTHMLMVMKMHRYTKYTKIVKGTTDLYNDDYYPRIQALDPVRGFFLYTIYSSKNHCFSIIRCSLNGDKCFEISCFRYEDTHKGMKSVAIDYEDQRIYWKNWYYHVSSSDLDGSNVRERHIPQVGLGFVYSDIHRQWIYVKFEKLITRFRKSDNLMEKLIESTSERPLDTTSEMKVISSTFETSEHNGCTVNNGGCEQFCFSGPNITCGRQDA